jgi:hypothetical protein
MHFAILLRSVKNPTQLAVWHTNCLECVKKVVQDASHHYLETAFNEHVLLEYGDGR